MSERFGKPQVFAGALLLCFVAQCLSLATRTALSDPMMTGHTRSSAAMLALTRVSAIFGPYSNWIARLAVILAGTLLGAVVWYIARRLFGNRAGYIALTLYCFSPVMVQPSAELRPEVIGGLGVFGFVFTAIAVAHTLYAPREVVLWNWRRILLLGVAINLGVAANPATVWILPLVLALMWYLVPHRRGAATLILLASCAVAAVLLTITYALGGTPILQSLQQAHWGGFSADVLQRGGVLKMIAVLLVRNGPGFVLLLVIALVTFAAWRHTRFFGTYASLIASLFLIAAGLLMPLAAGFGFLLIAMPFVYVFVSGVCADLLELRNPAWRSLVLGIILAALITHAVFSVTGLWAMGHMGQQHASSMTTE